MMPPAPPEGGTPAECLCALVSGTALAAGSSRLIFIGKMTAHIMQLPC
jgi:hypothetical protein